jgi:hypothetical protein
MQRAHLGMTGCGRLFVVGGSGSGGVVDDVFDFAAVDAEVAGDGALAAACAVPGPYRLLHRRRAGWHGWRIVRHCWRSPVRVSGGGGRRLDRWFGSDQGHEEFEGASQSEGGPGADQCADGSVTQAMGQVGADGGGDAGAQAPARQWWHRLVAPAGVQDEHAGRQNQPVHGEGQQPGRQAGLAVGGDKFISVPVGDDGRDRGDRGHGQGGGDPDEPVSHDWSPAAS